MADPYLEGVIPLQDITSQPAFKQADHDTREFVINSWFEDTYPMFPDNDENREAFAKAKNKALKMNLSDSFHNAAVSQLKQDFFDQEDFEANVSEEDVDFVKKRAYRNAVRDMKRGEEPSGDPDDPAMTFSDRRSPALVD